MPEAQPEIESWVFGGSRVGKGDKRLHEWIGPDRKPMLFKAKGSFTVGSFYSVKVSRDEDSVSYYGNPQYTGERSSDAELVAQLSAKHRAAEVTLSLKARERADKTNDPVEEAIERLCELAAHVPSSQRTAFAVYVTTRLMKCCFCNINLSDFLATGQGRRP